MCLPRMGSFFMPHFAQDFFETEICQLNFKTVLGNMKYKFCQSIAVLIIWIGKTQIIVSKKHDLSFGVTFPEAKTHIPTKTQIRNIDCLPLIKIVDYFILYQSIIIASSLLTLALVCVGIGL